MERYELLEHKADAYIKAYGATLEEAFENAAFAMFSIMTDITAVEEKLSYSIEIEASDILELLYNWLEHLLVQFETEYELCCRFEVKKIEKSNGALRLSANVYGEPYDAQKHPSRSEVKAVTYHKMDIGKENGRHVLKFILDL